MWYNESRKDDETSTIHSQRSWGCHGNFMLWVKELTVKLRFSWWIMWPLELWPMTSSWFTMKNWLWFLLKILSLDDCFIEINSLCIMYCYTLDALLHLVVSAFVCKECGATFRQSNIFHQHLKTHLKERTVLFCPREGCQRSYLDKRNLMSHILCFHDGQKFTCDHCQKQFYTKVIFQWLLWLDKNQCLQINRSKNMNYS
jgi:hypothetical protein